MWKRIPPDCVSLYRIACALGAVPKDDQPAAEPAGYPTRYSTKDEILAFQSRVNAAQRN